MGKTESIYERHKNPFFDEVKPYVPGPTMEEIAEISGLPTTRIIKLSSNENPLGPPPMAVEQVRKMAPFISLYPDSQAKELRNAIAQWLEQSFTAENIIIGAGSSETMSFIIRAFSKPLDEVICMDPTFTVYSEISLADGRRPVIIPLKPPEFKLRIEDVERALTEKTRVIFLTRPNNPTSRLIPLDEVRAIAEMVPDAVVVCDEAYIEFADNFRNISGINLISDDSNVLVTRTFSKAFGLCDLRVGYCVGPPASVKYLFKVKPKWNLGMVAQTTAIASLKDVKHLEETLQVVAEGRRYLTDKFTEIGLKVTPEPQGNYLFVKVSGLDLSAGELTHKLRKKGISIRGGTSDWGDDYVRISVGTKEQNDVLLREIKDILGG